MLSYITLARLLPETIFVQHGANLADKSGRRSIMILIDILSGLVVIGYLVAIKYKLLTIFYFSIKCSRLSSKNMFCSSSIAAAAA